MVHSLTELRLSVQLAETLSSPFLQIKNIAADLKLLSDDTFSLQLTSRKIESEFFSRISAINFSCPSLIWSQNKIECDKASVRIQHPLITQAWHMDFLFDTDKHKYSIRVRDGSLANGAINVSGDNTENRWQLKIDLDSVDIKWLQQEFSELFPLLQDYPVDNGILSATIYANWLGDRLIESDIDYVIDNLSIDSEQVLEQVSLSGKLHVDHEQAEWLIDNEMFFSSGAMYLTPGFDVFESYPGFYLDLNQQAINIDIDAEIDKRIERITVQTFDYNQGELLQMSGSGHINIEPELTLVDSRFSVRVNDLEQAYPVYIQPILLPTNYSDLDIAGSMAIQLLHEQGQLTKLDMDLNDIYIDDQKQRFGIAGFNSQISMTDSQQPVVSQISWQSISLYKLLFGPGDMQFISRENDYYIDQWKNVALLDGEIEIEDLTMLNLGEESFRFNLTGHLKPISLTSFTTTMGWPILSGNIAGEVTGLSYQNNHLEIDGDILFSAFDGQVRLSDFYIDNLFSSNARLHTDITVDALDLEQITNTFTFGKIQGTLNGYLNGFTLESWQPVAFDAALYTPENDSRPHRISQKALDNISELGGGITGALSSGFLRFIPEYSYGQLGIKCRLHQAICELGGINETETGFYILTKGGLLPPWVDVKGTGRSIEWQHLIDGLKHIAEGEISIQ